MSADLRGFTYRLEPVLQRRRWLLEASEAKLGHAQRDLTAVEGDLERLRAQHRTESERAARAWVERIDPAGHLALLRWLAALARAVHGAEAEVARRREARDAARERWLTEHRKVKLLEEHRTACVDEYAREELARGAREADRDWLGRRHATAVTRVRDASAWRDR